MRGIIQLANSSHSVRVEPLPRVVSVVSAGGRAAWAPGVVAAAAARVLLLPRRADTQFLLGLRRHTVARALSRSVVHLGGPQRDAEDVLVVSVLVLRRGAERETDRLISEDEIVDNKTKRYCAARVAPPGF